MVATSFTETSDPLSVAVVGSGIGGLTASLALRRAGHLVTVYEQSSLKSEFGAAINVPPNAYGVLKRLGVDPVEKGAVEMKWFTGYDKSGTSVKVNDFTQKSRIWQHKYLLAHRVDLHTQLKEVATSQQGTGFPVDLVTGAAVVDVDVENNTLFFKDGTKVQADLIVGADGVHSVCRTKLTKARPFPSGKSAYRFVLKRSEVRKFPDLAPVVERDGEMVFWSNEDRRIVMYPTRVDEVLNFVVIVPDPAADIEDKTWNKPGSRVDMLASFEGFDERALGLLRMAEEANLKIWTLTDMGPVEKWHYKSFCLLGDAAHPFLPHQGQGGAQAIEDAVALGVLFQRGTSPEEVPDILGLYQRCRKARAEYVQEVTRQSGADTGPEHHVDVQAVMKFFDYNCGHDEHDSATRMLRDWKYKEKSRVRWRMPTSLGPNQSPRQGFRGQRFTADDSTFETVKVTFKTSRTLLENLLPSPGFSFDHPGTFAHASWVVTTLDNMNWLGGTGYHLFGLYLHNVQYKKRDGSVLRGDFLAVMVEDLTDPILTGREEIGFPKLYSEINIQKTATSWLMRASWRGANYLKLELSNPQALESPKSTSSTDTFVYKYIPATGRPGYADVEYAVCAPFQQKQIVRSFQTTKQCSIEVNVHDEQRLPTLDHIVRRINELPVYEIIEGTVTTGTGVEDFSAAYRIE